MDLILVKITNTGDKWKEDQFKVCYQGVTEEELERIQDTESGYSYIGWDFTVEELGIVRVFPENWRNDESE